ncbi:MAG: VOC family protein [Gammaproteobacteria bacterium]|nr:VOC family protein [Gammaproteobacteria bacterium]
MLRAAIMVLAAVGSVSGPALCTEPVAHKAAAHGAEDNPMGLFIDHASLGVADLAGETDWYQRVLGFHVGQLRHRPNREVQQILIPGFRLDLIAQQGSTRPIPRMDTGKQGLLKVTFGVKDIEAAYKRLSAAGVDARASRDGSGKLTSLNFFDPEGNALEISQR